MRPRTQVPAAALWALCAAVPPPAAGADYSGYTGAELYHRFCESCHGRAGAGDGPVSRSLAVALPDLRRIAERHGGRFPDNWVYRVIDGREALLSHGPRDMPVWGVELWREQGADVTAGGKTRDAIAALVDYLRGLQAARGPAAPGPR
ncbi:MAG TPA: cytochrome c [Steroidobacteraceae bacterium]|nr:cytochrome c [Steroidobacteraceae bacterium]